MPVMMCGRIGCQLCVGRNIQTYSLDDEFDNFFHTATSFLFALPFYYLSEGFTASTHEVSWGRCRPRPPFRLLRSSQYELAEICRYKAFLFACFWTAILKSRSIQYRKY